MQCNVSLYIAKIVRVAKHVSDEIIRIISLYIAKIVRVAKHEWSYRIVNEGLYIAKIVRVAKQSYSSSVNQALSLHSKNCEGSKTC